MPTEKHEHSPCVARVWELTDYELIIAELACTEEGCDWADWDYGTALEKE